MEFKTARRFSTQKIALRSCHCAAPRSHKHWLEVCLVSAEGASPIRASESERDEIQLGSSQYEWYRLSRAINGSPLRGNHP